MELKQQQQLPNTAVFRSIPGPLLKVDAKTRPWVLPFCAN